MKSYNSILTVCCQDITVLQYIQKSNQKTPIYFVKMSAECQWLCSETSVGTLSTSSDDSDSPPTLLKQLVELEFFSDVGGSLSDGQPSRPASEIEQALGSTLVPAEPERQSANSVGETASAVVANSTLVDSCDNDRSPEVCVVNAAGEIVRMCDRGDGLSPVVVVGTPLADDAEQMSPKDIGEVDRPTSTLSSALSVELSTSDVDSEIFPLMAESELVDGLMDGFCSGLASFAGNVLQFRLLSTVALMNTIHRRCLETTISLAFDMAWDVICTPTRIKFARTKEVNAAWIQLFFYVSPLHGVTHYILCCLFVSANFW